MPVIFISYRREDSAGHAGRLFDRLRERFGRDHVFLDVVGIDAGVDFVDTLDKAVGSCDVLLAVIGREWLTCCDKQGGRRLDDPNDFIRAEISAALKRDVRVVPVLVQGAEMPPTDMLPEDLKRLTRRQAVELRDSRWDADVEALIAALERESARAGTVQPPAAAPPVARAEPAGPEPGRRSRASLWGIVAAIAIVVALLLWSPWSRDTEFTPSGPPQEVGEPTPTGEPTPAGELPDGGQTEEPPSEEETPADRVEAEAPQPMIEIPDVVGADMGTATEALLGAGFEIVRRSEPSEVTAANKVLRQEPVAGSRAKKGRRVTLVYSGGAPEQAGQAIVFIACAREADRRTAEGLESHLRGLRLQGIDYEVYMTDLYEGQTTGKVFYYPEEQADVARTIADRSSAWLSKTYGRRVLVETELDSSGIVEGTMMLSMPGSR